MLEQKLAAAGRPESADAGEIADLVNESIDWTRDLARGLSPVDLDHTSLPSALRELADKTQRLCRVRCTFEGLEHLDLADDATALNLYRVAQEAVNNAVKHAAAKHIRIVLRARGGTTGGVVLTVRDDGRGLGPAGAAPREGGGMGLRIMKYRAGVVGALFDVRSPDGGGTIVTCVLPVPVGLDVPDRAGDGARPGNRPRPKYGPAGRSGGERPDAERPAGRGAVKFLAGARDGLRARNPRR